MQLTVRLDDRRPVGCVRLENHELSYFIGRGYWGNGYGASAVANVLNIVSRRRNGELLRAFTDRSNVASIRILEGNGFEFSGLRRCHDSSRCVLGYSYGIGCT
jgi:RimJ/RimL family protein N-acetyltransferase